MKKTLRDSLRLIRPRQWIKNFAIFAAITFSGQLFQGNLFVMVFCGFLVFCGMSSAIYVINDLFDIEKDKLHPFKRFRPLAHGDISISAAVGIAAILFVLSLLGSYYISTSFFLLTLAYFALQLAYSMFLKHIAVIDILALAAGYILRVYAGEIISGFHISAWLLLTTISLSLFLAIGKRRSELTLISGHSAQQIAATRKSLSHYSDRLLDVYASIFATSTFLSYTLFTFLENPHGITINNDLLLSDFLPVYFQRKWLMVTIIPVVYGLMRYLQDIYEKHEGESPEKVLLSDKPLLFNIIIWIVLVIVIIYVFGA